MDFESFGIQSLIFPPDGSGDIEHRQGIWTRIPCEARITIIFCIECLDFVYRKIYEQGLSYLLKNKTEYIYSISLLFILILSVCGYKPVKCCFFVEKEDSDIIHFVYLLFPQCISH